MSVININLFSMMLRRTIDVTVVLPDKINDDEKLPCVWLYHGGSGDHTEWLYHTSLVDTVNERHFAAVLPEVFESCFVNMNIGDRYESFVAKELPSTIHNMFACISDDRKYNYVSGFSNGGYGCYIQPSNILQLSQRLVLFLLVIKPILYLLMITVLKPKTAYYYSVTKISTIQITALHILRISLQLIIRRHLPLIYITPVEVSIPGLT